MLESSPLIALDRDAILVSWGGPVYRLDDAGVVQQSWQTPAHMEELPTDEDIVSVQAVVDAVNAEKMSGAARARIFAALEIEV
jgi:hypothetical protein